MGERAYSYVKRKQPPPASGYTNFYTTPYGIGLKIGSLDYGFFDMSTPEAIIKGLAFRDKCRAKQGLPPADY